METFGEKAVGVVLTQGLNTDKISEVQKVKETFANMINLIESLPSSNYLDNTLKGMAIRDCIRASSSTVKFLTYKE